MRTAFLARPTFGKIAGIQGARFRVAMHTCRKPATECGHHLMAERRRSY
ncbi:hypothetical protein [Xanthomonas vasicola]|nr:hypothetical protein [Xanthomonas vasicola]MBV6893728.1 hypothetical protein [Xanthomonas vasicola pv. vasculorum]MDO6961457.1 hypothetical protein [Xanthomonas vasicola]